MTGLRCFLINTWHPPKNPAEPFMRTILGFDIGGTKTALVEGTYNGLILERSEWPTEAGRPFRDTFPIAIATAKKCISRAEKAQRTIDAISVSIGGPLQIEEGRLINPPHLPGWHGVALKQYLQRELPGYPVYVEHDGNAGALAEFHFGIGKQYHTIQHLIFLTFGTGLGAGIIIHGRVLRGASDTAGEVGHWRLDSAGPVGFGKEGSWEGFASGTALVKLAHRRNPKRWPETTPIREVVEAMLSDDPEALDVAEEAGIWMGRGMALLIDAFNPQVIVLGSLAVVLGDRILKPAREEVAREALPQAVEACKIVPAVLGNSIGDVAALMAAVVEQPPAPK